MRIKIATITVTFLFIVLFAGLLNLQLVQGGRNRQLSDKNCIRLLAQLGGRGKIFDRNASIIVDNRLSYDLLLLPQQKEALDKSFATASRVLGVSQKTLRDAYKSNYVASSIPVTISRNIELKKAIALEELKMESPGIIIQPVPLRHYPYGRLACHLIGYLNEIDRWRLTKLEDYGYKTKDIVGFGGVEEKLDYYLRQEEGGLSVEVDHRGRFVRVLGFKSPQNGKDVGLTLDLKIQKIAEEAIDGRKGSVVIMDPNTGEIFAMANYPNFNPSVFVEKNNTSIARLFSDPGAPLINRAITGAYPAGSVFKVVVATAGLETGKIKPSTTFRCTGAVLVGRKEFKCWDVHHDQNLDKALAHSCNTYFYRTGLMLGPEPMRDYALKFGLSKNTSFDLPYEVDGFIPSALWRKVSRFKNWYDGDTANLSIGQGDVLVTPLQLARAMALFANGGKLVTPHVLKSIDGKDASHYSKKVIQVPVKPKNLESVKNGLRDVVLDPQGTANVIAGVPVEVAGKTGTAQAPPGQPHAWFVGFFPYKNPKYVICVFQERGGPGYVSSVLAKQIIEKMLAEGLI